MDIGPRRCKLPSQQMGPSYGNIALSLHAHFSSNACRQRVEVHFDTSGAKFDNGLAFETLQCMYFPAGAAADLDLLEYVLPHQVKTASGAKGGICGGQGTSSMCEEAAAHLGCQAPPGGHAA